jgi:hypothetical protein
MQNARRIAAALALTLAAVPASAGTLYKSVGPNGVIQFSDLPPSDNSQVVERRPLESIGSVRSAAQSNVMNVSQSLDSDESIVRANAQVDLAEHALALARRAIGSELEGLKLTTQRATVSDVERVEFYKRGVIAARQNLLEVLRLRATPDVVLASR